MDETHKDESQREAERLRRVLARVRQGLDRARDTMMRTRDVVAIDEIRDLIDNEMRS